MYSNCNCTQPLKETSLTSIHNQNDEDIQVDPLFDIIHQHY